MSRMLFSCIFLFSVACSHAGNWATADGMQDGKREAEMIEALLGRENDKCLGKRCQHSAECCQGTTCVDIEGASGTCLSIYSKASYQPCEKDEQCSGGLVCTESGYNSPSKTCQLDERSIKRGFNDMCVTSADCDTSNGLCCQVIRRHRMAPRKLCYYFQDPQSCLGEVQTNLKPITYVPNPFFKARLGKK